MNSSVPIPLDSWIHLPGAESVLLAVGTVSNWAHAAHDPSDDPRGNAACVADIIVAEAWGQIDRFRASLLFEDQARTHPARAPLFVDWSHSLDDTAAIVTQLSARPVAADRRDLSQNSSIDGSPIRWFRQTRELLWMAQDLAAQSPARPLPHSLRFAAQLARHQHTLALLFRGWRLSSPGPLKAPDGDPAYLPDWHAMRRRWLLSSSHSLRLGAMSLFSTPPSRPEPAIPLATLFKL